MYIYNIHINTYKWRYCKIAKRHVMFIGILARIGKRIWGGRAGENLKKWRVILGEIMAGDLRQTYGGRFARKIWREICGENMVGRPEVNPNTAVNDAEQ